MESDLVILTLIFFLVSIFYSSVGFGGGSSYLAFMALWAISPNEMKPTALLCNIIVVAGGTWLFYKRGYITWKHILPLVVLSIPMAFIGGYLPISERFFFLLLGAALVSAGLLMFYEVIFLKRSYENDSPKGLVFNSITGSGIGLLSGMVGIGGGIFLSPILHITKWGGARKIAATASFFILVNSVAGLAGQFVKTQFMIDYSVMIPLALTVFAGGQIGSRLGSKYLDPNIVKSLTALLVMYVGLRILLYHLWEINI